MQRLQEMIQRRVFTLLLLLLAGGFVVLLAELLWTGHTDGIQLVAVAASIAGLVLTGLGMVLGRSAGMVLAALLLLLSLTGLIGTFEHLEEGEKAVGDLPALAADSSRFATIGYLADSTQESEGREGREEGKATPPPLAPLSLAGLSVMGAVVLLGRRQELNPAAVAARQTAR